MPWLTSVIKIEGNLDGLSFYKTRHGYIVRRAGGFNGLRIKHEARYRRTRENAQEFGRAAKAGKLLRHALRILIQDACDNRVTPRLTQLMRRVMDFDVVSARGERNATNALLRDDARRMLKGFQFNTHSLLTELPAEVSRDAGTITVKGIALPKHAASVSGATHLVLTGAQARVDFEEGTYSLAVSDAVVLPLADACSKVVLKLKGKAEGKGTDMFVVKVALMQEVNGQLCALQNKAFNSLCIAEVAGADNHLPATPSPLLPAVQHNTVSKTHAAIVDDAFSVPACLKPTRRMLARVVMRN